MLYNRFSQPQHQSDQYIEPIPGKISTAALCLQGNNSSFFLRSHWRIVLIISLFSDRDSNLRHPDSFLFQTSRSSQLIPNFGTRRIPIRRVSESRAWHFRECGATSRRRLCRQAQRYWHRVWARVRARVAREATTTSPKAGLFRTGSTWQDAKHGRTCVRIRGRTVLGCKNSVWQSACPGRVRSVQGSSWNRRTRPP